MDRLPFGATCSPFVAIQTTRRAATEANAPTEIVDAIKKKMYVNDYLGSAPTAAIGLQEAIAVKDVLASADLHLQGWRSNSKEFIEEIRKNMKPANSPTPSLISEEENGKVLGVLWNSKTDTLGFQVSELENLEYTRMTIASKVASAFDPLGTAAPLIVKAKVRLRELGTRGLKWSERISESDQSWWEEWFATAQQLSEFSFSRCLFPNES